MIDLDITCEKIITKIKLWLEGTTALPPGMYFRYYKSLIINYVHIHKNDKGLNKEQFDYYQAVLLFQGKTLEL